MNFKSTTQFHTSVPHKDHTFSAPKIPQLNTKNPSVQHSFFNVELRRVWNWGGLGQINLLLEISYLKWIWVDFQPRIF